jgi:hypothetical protein
VLTVWQLERVSLFQDRLVAFEREAGLQQITIFDLDPSPHTDEVHLSPLSRISHR